MLSIAIPPPSLKSPERLPFELNPLNRNSSRPTIRFGALKLNAVWPSTRFAAAVAESDGNTTTRLLPYRQRKSSDPE